MSDYAGVIGNVATIVGAATGQVWLQAAGMAISAWGASQQVLPGPKIGDVQRQTSQEGGFRPIVYGRSHPIAGNIIADGGPVIVMRQERQGKGGPKVESESAYRTYAVGVCEGDATLLQAWRNGILVYDAEDGSMAAENAAFLEYATWYTGSFDQPASPDLEEVYGAGQAPYFRGTAYLSIHNEDVTDQRGAWSQWQFRVFRGAARSYTTPPYPIQVQERHSQNISPMGGQLRSILNYGSSEDHHSMMVQPLGGQLRLPLQTYDYGDEHSLSVIPLGGQLRIPLQDTSSEDSHSQTIEVVGGQLRKALLSGEGEPSEHTMHVQPLGGQLS